MVHLTFDLNTTADINRGHIFKAINDFIFHQHKYIPHDTYITECLRRGQSATSLCSRLDVWRHDWNEYVRDPDHFGRTDDWGRKQCYYEWGWKTATGVRTITPKLRGHSRVNDLDDAISTNYPLHPADIIYELRIRKLTEWGIREVEELRTFADKVIRRFGAEYKPHDTYTDSEVAAWIDMVDYAQNEMTLVCSQQMEGGTDKKAWICRCCKMAHLSDGTGTLTDDHGANPFPLYSSEFKVCQDCDQSFVLPLRMIHASGKNGSKRDFHFLQKESSPFYYPKPEGWKPCPDKRENERNFGKFYTQHQVSETTPMPGAAPDIDDTFNCPWERKERTLYVEARQTEKMVRNKMLGYIKEANDKGGFGISPVEHKRILREQLKAREVNWKGYAEESVAKAVEEVKKEMNEEMIETQMMTARSVEVWKEIEAEKKEIKKFAEQGRSAVKTLSAPLHQKNEALKKEIANRDNLIQELKAQLVPFNQHPKLSQVIRMKAVLKQWGKCHRLEVVGKDALTYGPGGKYPVRADEVANIVPKKSIAPPQKQKKKKVVDECPCVICEKQFPRKSLIEKGGDLWCRKCQ